ncbi:MAG: D-tyrosyl-tRNA(Tyr) deacylase [Planctomycetota bacterium]|nr:MAG: D-tyrosyl-tRNA(Tyr) deacylase [Planctomycetota bacterium]
MIALLQRVTRGSVRVDAQCVGSIERGAVVLLGIGKDDNAQAAARLAAKVAKYRFFPSEDGTKPMHQSLLDLGLAALVVSQFTLCADTRKGLRPGFDPAADPSLAEPLYELFCEELSAAGVCQVERGRFRAMMQVELVNDGPVTLWLES